MTTIADSNAESFELLNLHRYTKYRVTVNAINRLGEGTPVTRVFVSPETCEEFNVITNLHSITTEKLSGRNDCSIK